MTGSGALDPLEPGCALVVGTVGADAVPEATRGWSVEVLGDGGTARVLVPADAATTLENLRANRGVAVTATDVVTMRSVQLKGHATAIEAPTSDDLARQARYAAEFFRLVHQTDGTDPALLARLLPAGFTAFVMTVEELFDQTPGPTAGARLSPAGG